MNKPILDFINNPNSINHLNLNLDDITFDVNNYSKSKLLSCFKENGIVVINNFLDKSIVDALKSKIDPLLNVDSLNNIDVSNNMINFRKLRRQNPSKLLVNIRDNADKGMIDIYNIDKILDKENFKKLKLTFSSDLMQSLLLAKSNQVNFDLTLNAYYNKGIKSTRGFHVDAFYPVLKAMIYLSDVNCYEDGAYCYVKKSHKKNYLTEINKKISNKHIHEFTDTPFVEINQVTPVLGRAGTLIFSDQAGAHRGLPQSDNRDRTMLVAKFIRN